MSNELDELLGRPLGTLYDDDELLAELEEMDVKESEIQSPPTIPKTLNDVDPIKHHLPLPEEPQEDQDDREERELAELQTELA